MSDSQEKKEIEIKKGLTIFLENFQEKDEFTKIFLEEIFKILKNEKRL
jgi:hypothetical protein